MTLRFGWLPLWRRYDKWTGVESEACHVLIAHPLIKVISKVPAGCFITSNTAPSTILKTVNIIKVRIQFVLNVQMNVYWVCLESTKIPASTECSTSSGRLISLLNKMLQVFFPRNSPNPTFKSEPRHVAMPLSQSLRTGTCSLKAAGCQHRGGLLGNSAFCWRLKARPLFSTAKNVNEN